MEDHRRAVAALLVAVALAGPAVVRARDPLSTFDTAPKASPGAVPTSDPAARFVIQSSADFGRTTALVGTYVDGTQKDLNLNQGFGLGVGFSTLYLAGGHLATQVVMGFEYSGVAGSNGALRWIAYPLEVMEVLDLGPVRLSSGISYLIAPRISGVGIASELEVKLENSLGWLGEADFLFHVDTSARRPTWWIGGRYERQRLRNRLGGPSVQADAIGLVVGSAL
jgi:hypothetical protein